MSKLRAIARAPHNALIYRGVRKAMGNLWRCRRQPMPSARGQTLPCVTIGAARRIPGKTCRFRHVSLGKNFRRPLAEPERARIFR
jgi:hypothetical protein